MINYLIEQNIPFTYDGVIHVKSRLARLQRKAKTLKQEEFITYLIEQGVPHKVEGTQVLIFGSSKSGFHGHAGRPGKRGGSASKGGIPLRANAGTREVMDRHIVANVPGALNMDSYTEGINDSDIRATVKDNLVSAIAETSGEPYEDVNEVIAQWSESANDNDYQSLSIQEAISEEFGVPLSNYQKGKIAQFGQHRDDQEFMGWVKEYKEISDRLDLGPDLSMLKNAELQSQRYQLLAKIIDKTGGMAHQPLKYAPILPHRDDWKSATQKIVRAMYDNTQAKLKEDGVENVNLFRGVRDLPEALYTPQKWDIYSLKDNAASSWSRDFQVSSSFGSITLGMRVPASKILSSCVTGFGCLSEQEYVVLGGNNEARVFRGESNFSEASFSAKTLGSSKSGFHGHAGRPGKRGGSAAQGKIYSAMEFEAFFPLGALTAGQSERQDVKQKVITDLSEKSGLDPFDVNHLVKQWAESANDTDPRSLSLQEAISEEFGVPLSEWQKGKIEKVTRMGDATDFRNTVRGQEKIEIHDMWEARAKGDIGTDLAKTKIRLIQQKYRKEFDEKFPNIQEDFDKSPFNLNYIGTSFIVFPKSVVPRSDERKFVRAMYEHTQTELGKAGFSPQDKVGLYRGTVSADHHSLGSSVQLVQNAAGSWTTSQPVALLFTRQEYFNFKGKRMPGYVVRSDVPVSSILSTAITGLGCLTETETVVLGKPLTGVIDLVRPAFADLSEKIKDVALKLAQGEKTFRYEDNKIFILGGPGSGNFGHAGRKGKVGGSAPKRGALAASGVVPKDRIHSEHYEILDTAAYGMYMETIRDVERRGSGLADFERIGVDDVGAITQDMAREVAADTDVSSEMIADAARAWTLGPYNPNSVMIQKAASDVFGVPMTPYNENALKTMPPGPMIKENFMTGKEETIQPLAYEDAVKIVKVMYNETQRYLDAFPESHYRLYRGASLAKGEGKTLSPGEIKEIQLSPISSFSVGRHIANRFSENTWPDGAVFGVDVPKERIFSLFVTGIGSVVEGEVMVMGGVGDVAEIVQVG